MIQLKNIRSEQLTIPFFAAEAGQGWCLVGRNNSGVDLFCEHIATRFATAEQEQCRLPEDMGVFTYKRQQELFEEEIKKDETDYLDRIDAGTPAIDFLKNPSEYEDIIAACNMTGSMAKGYRQLSSGQSRKLFLLKEITMGVSCLVVQNPYEGIDPKSCQEMDQMFASLLHQGMLLIMILNNRDDIPFWCTHIGVFDKMCLGKQGKRTDLIATVDELFAQDAAQLAVETQELHNEQAHKKEETSAPLLVRLVNGFAEYGGNPVFSGVNCDRKSVPRDRFQTNVRRSRGSRAMEWVFPYLILLLLNNYPILRNSYNVRELEVLNKVTSVYC